MLSNHHFQIPDRVFFALSFLVFALTMGFVIWAMPNLPATLPSHFGFDGQPDNYTTSKTFILLFPPLMQLIMIFMISWAYRHPRYFNYPTHRNFASFPPIVQGALQTLGRHLLAILLLIAVLIMAHLSEGIVMTGLDLSGAPDPGVLIFLTGFLFLSIGVYGGWMMRIIRRGTTDDHPLQG